MVPGSGARGAACDNPVVSDTTVELAAIERGAGPAVTLIHGGVFHSGPAWAKTIGPLVQAGYRVIAVDRRGYGRSPPGDTDQISVNLQARDVATTLRLREVEASHVAGVSYGALVALELALARPELVLSLTLVEPTIFSWLKGDPDYEPWVHRFTELESLGIAGTPHQVWLEPWLSLMDPAMARSLRPGSPAWPLVERALHYQWREEPVSAYRPDEDGLAALAAPTLIVNGGDSEPALREVGELLAERLPSAQHVEMPGVGHELHAQCAGAFNQLLEAFLARNSSDLVGFQVQAHRRQAAGIGQASHPAISSLRSPDASIPARSQAGTEDPVSMISKIAVLCWEESRPWVSALRQNGYSVPWVEEPKGDSYKQIPRLEPDLVLIDLTRLPDQGKAMAVTLAGNDALSGIPIVVVSEKDSATRGLKGKVENLVLTNPSDIVTAVKSALSGRD
jgi:pimeloyl-ACP methyl ester carboxylesterase